MLLEIAATDNDTESNVTVLFQPTAAFYRDMTMTVEANQMIDIVMVVSRSRDYTGTFNSTEEMVNAPFMPINWGNATSYLQHLGPSISPVSTDAHSMHQRRLRGCLDCANSATWISFPSTTAQFRLFAPTTTRRFEW